MDHRGHGRGLRPIGRFRLADCAADAAAVLSQLGAAPAVVVGYSMGGAIAQLLARDHPEVVSGLVLSGTSQHWQDPQAKRYFKTMLFLGMMISLAPKLFWRFGLWQMGLRGGEQTIWLHSELMRHSARDIAEARRDPTVAMPGELQPEEAVFAVLTENEARFPEAATSGWRARMLSRVQ